MDQQQIGKTVIKALLLGIIILIGFLTYTVYKNLPHPLVIVIGAGLAIAVRALMVKVDEMTITPPTTEQKVVMKEDMKKKASNLTGCFIPLMIIAMILLSSPGTKKLIKKLFKMGKEQVEKELKMEKKKKITDGILVDKNKYGEKIEYLYKDGKLNGTTRVYYDSGKLKSTWQYLDGKLEGKSYVYYENGKINKIQPYKNHKLDGWYIAYNKKGKVIEKWLYKNGEVVRKAVTYTPKKTKKNTIKERNLEQGR